jgi:hypothetical protein
MNDHRKSIKGMLMVVVMVKIGSNGKSGSMLVEGRMRREW